MVTGVTESSISDAMDVRVEHARMFALWHAACSRCGTVTMGAIVS
jgi:hypothetical protein